jgi:CRP/FNR family cyclic AMP-dependent transcriptional regulator
MDDSKNLQYWLKKVKFFHILEVGDADVLATHLTPYTYPAGEVIFSQDDDGDSLFIVSSGKIELYIHDFTREKIILKVAGPGDYFGELALLNDEGRRSASAITLEPSTCYILTRTDLLAFLHKQPDVAIDLLSELSKEIRSTNTLLRGRVSRNPNTEIADDLTKVQRVADWVAHFSGSIIFLFINIIYFAIWISINTGLVPGVQVFDPYPFNFLTLAVSLEAICLSIFVLLSQNMQVARDKIHSDIEYEVNLKAELEIAYLHEKIDKFHEDNLKLFHALAHHKEIK